MWTNSDGPKLQNYAKTAQTQLLTYRQTNKAKTKGDYKTHSAYSWEATTTKKTTSLLVEINFFWLTCGNKLLLTSNPPSKQPSGPHPRSTPAPSPVSTYCTVASTLGTRPPADFHLEISIASNSFQPPLYQKSLSAFPGNHKQVFWMVLPFSSLKWPWRGSVETRGCLLSGSFPGDVRSPELVSKTNHPVDKYGQFVTHCLLCRSPGNHLAA